MDGNGQTFRRRSFDDPNTRFITESNFNAPSMIDLSNAARIARREGEKPSGARRRRRQQKARNNRRIARFAPLNRIADEIGAGLGLVNAGTQGDVSD